MSRLLRYWQDALLFIVLFVLASVVGYRAVIGEASLLTFFGVLLWVIGLVFRWMKYQMYRTWAPENIVPERLAFLSYCKNLLQIAGALLAAVDYFVW